MTFHYTGGMCGWYGFCVSNHTETSGVWMLKIDTQRLNKTQVRHEKTPVDIPLDPDGFMTGSLYWLLYNPHIVG